MEELQDGCHLFLILPSNKKLTVDKKGEMCFWETSERVCCCPLAVFFCEGLLRESPN